MPPSNPPPETNDNLTPDDHGASDSRRRQAELAQHFIEEDREARRHAVEDRPAFEGLQDEPTASYFDVSDRRKPGRDNWKGFGFDLHPQVTFASVTLLTVFIVLTLMFRERADVFFQSALDSITVNFGWFLILGANVLIIAALVFAFSRFGTIRIGGPDAKPEFSTFGWFAMLLSAGMGIGLMFWSVGEPIYHFGSPSPLFGVEGGTPEALQAALGTTFFHWGLHPWAIYAIVALGLAFFTYNRGLPLTIRSIFYPLLGDRIYGFWGNVIDVLSVLATLFGLATSLGLGVSQVAAGLEALFGTPTTTTFKVILIVVITGAAVLSVVAGLDKGVKRLSQLNMGLAALLLFFVLVVGPTVFILGGLTQSIGFYLQNFAELSLWTETFRDTNWQGSWTVFYWAWWISWSPFVGMFIARVSKGRTVREFILGVMVVPTLLSLVWLATFGGAALNLQASGVVDLVAAVNADVATALFVMLESFPLAAVTSVIGILLVVVFFVTSSDSGSLVVDHLTSGGKLDSPRPQRVFWAVMEGVVAAVLLIGGGLTTLQTAAVATGLPFALILLFMVWALYVGFRRELFALDALKREERVAQRLDEFDRHLVDRLPVSRTPEAERAETTEP
jgi:choline/glycine/proline betaine transport protein